MRLIESAPEKPIILDIRDTLTYAKSPVKIPDSLHVTPQELQTGVTTLEIEPRRTVVAYCT